MTNSYEILMRLLHVALCDDAELSLPADVNWTEVMDLSYQQGVAALAVDGVQKFIESCPESVSGLDAPEFEEAWNEWLGQSLIEEMSYFERESVTKRLARMWSAEGVSTVILKGASISQYYPCPYHRFSCDLDLFLGDEWEKGCSALERHGVDVSYEIYKDAQFHVKGVYVECHRYLMSIRGNDTLRRCELYLRSLLREGLVKTDVESLYMPSLMFNVIFCIEHARGHLLYDKLNLRFVCDWIVLRRQAVDWDEFWRRCDEFGFRRFAELFDSLADLLEGKLSYEDLSPAGKRVVDEMMAGEKEEEASPDSFFKRRVRQMFRTLRNGWKYREFNDVSMPVSLVRQIWTHFFDKKVKL